MPIDSRGRRYEEFTSPSAFTASLHAHQDAFDRRQTEQYESLRRRYTVPLPASPSTVVGECLRKMTIPAFSELNDDVTCMICHEGFLTGDAPELPMKLPCGHIAGAQCLLRWLAPLTTTGNNNCPTCRAAILDARDASAARVPRDAEASEMVARIDRLQADFNSIRAAARVNEFSEGFGGMDVRDGRSSRATTTTTRSSLNNGTSERPSNRGGERGERSSRRQPENSNARGSQSRTDRSSRR